MSVSCLGFIESNTTGTGRLFALAARSIGVSPLLFTANPDHYGYVSREGIEVVPVETSNESELLAACLSINSNRQLVGVASSSEYFVAAVSATQKTPFTNSIVVGTEAVRPVWQALQSMTDAATLTRLVVAGAQPDSEKMYRRTVEGFTVATELANELVRSGTDFRTAHRAVGESIRHSLDHNEPTLSSVARRLESLDPAEIVSKTSYGGGPAPKTLDHCLSQCRESWSAAAQALRTLKRKWHAADELLAETIAELCTT